MLRDWLKLFLKMTECEECMLGATNFFSFFLLNSRYLSNSVYVPRTSSACSVGCRSWLMQTYQRFEQSVHAFVSCSCDLPLNASYPNFMSREGKSQRFLSDQQWYQFCQSKSWVLTSDISTLQIDVVASAGWRHTCMRWGQHTLFTE